VPARAERCIAWLDNLTVHILAIAYFEDSYFALMIIGEVDNAIVALTNAESV